MARYGANELFNPGKRRKKKKEGVTTGSGPSIDSFGSMAHSQAPNALGMMSNAMELDEKFNDGDLTKMLQKMFK